MKNFFRKVAFGLKPDEQIPSDPLAWAQKQVDTIPELNWKGKYVLPEKEMRQKWGDYRYQEDVVIRKKFKNDAKGFERAIDQLIKDSGHDYFPNSELSIRHAEAIRGNSPVLAKLWFFWANHFTISDTQMLRHFSTGPYQRDYIRANLNQSFEKMAIEGTLAWPMIIHLDNKDNVGPNSESGKEEWRRKEKEPATLNENHARELMELHTISPNAGYTQEDVIELAKIMTGWRPKWTKKKDLAHDVQFFRKYHERGKKTVLGKEYKAGKKALEAVIKDLVKHPSCKEFIAIKLCRYLITDNPTKEMTDPIVKAWEKSDGFLPEVHKAALKVAFEYNDKHQKFQNPENWWLQMINMSGATYAHPVPEYEMDKFVFGYDMSENMKFTDWLLEDLGCNPYASKQPNGYSDISTDWMSTELIIRRLLYAKKAFYKYNVTDLNDYDRHEKIVRNNYDKPDEILKILSKAKTLEERHILLFNLPETLKA